MTALLKAGVPLSKLDSFRDRFEQNAFALSDSSHLRRLIPFILQDEMCKLKQDIGSVARLILLKIQKSRRSVHAVYII